MKYVVGANRVLSVRDGASLMRDEKLSSLVFVTDDGGVCGILTEQDVVRKFVAGEGINHRAGLLMQAQDMMTKDPVCHKVSAKGENYVEACLQLMAKRSFRHVPIVDANNRLVTCVDVSTAVASGKAVTLAHTLSFSAGKLLRIFRASKAGSTATSFLLESDTVRTAALKMAAEKQSSLLVVNETAALIGIVTESDLVRKVVACGKPFDLRIPEVMTPNPFTVQPEANPFDCLHEMIKHGFRHLPVVENGGQVLAILDILSLVKISYRSHVQMKACNEHTTDQCVWDNLVRNEIPKRDTQEVTGEQDVEIEDMETHVSVEETVHTTEQATSLDMKPSEQLALQLIMESKFEEAIAHLSKAIEEEDGTLDKIRLYTRRGHVKSCVGYLDEALCDLEHARTLGRSVEGIQEPVRNTLLNGIYEVFVEVLIEKGRFEQVVTECEDIALAPEKTNFFVEQLEKEVAKYKDLGKTLFMNMDYSNAAVTYTNALRAQQAANKIKQEQASSNVLHMMAILYGNRAACYQRMNDLKYAIQDASKSIECNKGYTKAWVRLCNCLYDKGSYEDCLQKAKDAIEIVQKNNEPSLFEKIKHYRDRAQDKIDAKQATRQVNMNSIKALGQVFAKTAINKETTENQALQSNKD